MIDHVLVGLFLVFALLCMIDYSVTYNGLSSGSFEERNPLVNGLISTFGLSFGLFVALAINVVFAAIITIASFLDYVSPGWKVAALVVMVAAVAMRGAVVVFNAGLYYG